MTQGSHITLLRITRRTGRMALLIGCAFLALILRLWFLQVVAGEYYSTLSANNRIRLYPLEAPRGFLLDRHGELLVENRASFDVYVTLEDIPPAQRREVSDLLSRILRMEQREIAARFAEAGLIREQPFLLRKGIEEAAFIALEERRLDLPGVSVRIRPVRAYPAAVGAATLLGYVSEINQTQLQHPEYQDFRLGETIGQAGIEKRYDAFIRGIDGGEQLEVDARGRILRLLDRRFPQAGFTLVLTLDAGIQRVTERAFAGLRGAVVVLQPQTGEILALVSNPSYDPAVFTQRMTSEMWSRLADDPTHPMQNRALQAQYPPGSIFKLITALAGLESGALTPGTTFSCSGTFTLGGHTFDDWKPEGHGTLDLMGGISNSCNIYFYQAALKTGPAEIIRVAREFGLGRPLRTGLADEAAGFLPSAGSNDWFPGNTVMLGIGQGSLTVTPLQTAAMVAAIANGGKLYRPFVLKRVENLERETVEEYGPEEIRQVNISPKNLEIVRRGMQGVVHGGTGFRAQVPGVTMAGKTGTAQVARKLEGRRTPEELKDHAWFVAFAPYENPQVALAIIAEHAGFGGTVAAPVARAIIEAALRLPPSRPQTPEGTVARRPSRPGPDSIQLGGTASDTASDQSTTRPEEKADAH